ncbi:MAG: hypothetical protein JKY61_12905 [Planctomycetes bacterium]|nr:hypothetical protein [Planctomycetota bacterium]
MSFDSAFAGAHETMCSPAIFGTPVVIRRGDGSAEFAAQGVFMDNGEEVDVEGVPISTNVHTIDLRKDALEWEPQMQDLVIDGPQTWVVANLTDEGQGILTLMLHKED